MHKYKNTCKWSNKFGRVYRSLRLQWEKVSDQNQFANHRYKNVYLTMCILHHVYPVYAACIL